MKSSKCTLRTKLKEELKSQLNDSVSHEVEECFYSFIANIVEKKHIEHIGLFAPLKDEVRINWSSLENFNLDMAFPYFVGTGEMLFKKCHVENLVSHDGFGVEILTPRETDQNVDPELIIVPGLGFGLNGERLGRGKGFYDRYLSGSDALKIGIGAEFQICNNIPCDAHDVYLDGLITQKGIRFFKRL